MRRNVGLVLLAVCLAQAAHAQAPVGYGDWRLDAPGVRHQITPASLPAPFATRSAGNGPSVVPRPPGALPRVPAGFAVQLYASELDGPREMKLAPNGDVFVVESAAGRVRVLRPGPGGQPVRSTVFATGLDQPFGIAFYPPGPKPDFVYVANNNAVLRFAYQPGDLTARLPPETIVSRLSPDTGGHWTRDIAFSPDGARMFVSIGSASNVAQGLPRRTQAQIATLEHDQGVGAVWGDEEGRARVLSFRPDGSQAQVYATGLRNCVGLAVHPASGDLWCSTNERDGLGDNLPPDYVSRVRPGAFFGWPWYYTGGNEDPRHRGERPDLAQRSTVPDVLIQPHSAPLAMTFYHAPPQAPAAFPAGWEGDGIVALHGSWNRSLRTGYKVVRVLTQNGVPTGIYEDLLTGFVADDNGVWGRPVGVAVAADGALLVSEDGNGTIWRVAPVR